MTVFRNFAVKQGLAIFSLMALLSTSPSHADDKPTGAVVEIGGDESPLPLTAARESGGAHWQARVIHPRLPSIPEPPKQAVDELQRFYTEADFLRCLSLLQERALELERLLQDRHVEEAARVVIFGSACALGAGDPLLAERMLQELYVADLPGAALQLTSPQVQALAEKAQGLVADRGHAELSIVSQPPGARLQIDGRTTECRTPCHLTLRRGVHRIGLQRPGYLPRDLSLDHTAAAERTVALDPASSSVALQQLEETARTVKSFDDADLGALATTAFAVQVAVLHWHREGRVYAALYDRRRQKIIARANAPSSHEASRIVIRSVIREWRGQVEPRPIWKHPAFWTVTLTVAAAVGVTVWLLTRPEQKSYAFEFR